MIALLAMLATITLDSTTCSSSVITNCPHAAANQAGAKPSNTTPSFSTGASGETLLLFVNIESNCSQTRDVTSITNSGCSFSTAWTKIDGATTNCGTASVYKAVTSATCTGITTTVNISPNSEMALTLLAYSSTVAVGSHNAAPISVAASQVTVTGTTSGSLVYAVGQDSGDGSITLTMTSNATQLRAEQDSIADAFWEEYLTSVSSGGSVTIGVTAPTDQSGAIAAVEICDGTCGGGGGATAPRSSRARRGAGAWLEMPEWADRRRAC